MNKRIILLSTRVAFISIAVTLALAFFLASRFRIMLRNEVREQLRERIANAITQVDTDANAKLINPKNKGSENYLKVQ